MQEKRRLGAGGHLRTLGPPVAANSGIAAVRSLVRATAALGNPPRAGLLHHPAGMVLEPLPGKEANNQDEGEPPHRSVRLLDQPPLRRLHRPCVHRIDAREQPDLLARPSPAGASPAIARLRCRAAWSASPCRCSSDPPAAAADVHRASRRHLPLRSSGRWGHTAAAPRAAGPLEQHRHHRQAAFGTLVDEVRDISYWRPSMRSSDGLWK